MEARDIVLGDFLEGPYLKSVGEGLLDSHLVLAWKLHKEDVDDIEHEQNQSLEELHLVTHQKDCDNDQVQQDEDRFTSNNPPVDQSLRRHDQVKYTCMLQQHG